MRPMDQAARFHETLRRLAIIDEGLAERQAGLGLDPAGISALDPKTAALVRVGALAAIGSPGACLEWGTTRALAAGATEDEITGGARAACRLSVACRMQADGVPRPGTARLRDHPVPAALCRCHTRARRPREGRRR